MTRHACLCALTGALVAACGGDVPPPISVMVPDADAGTTGGGGGLLPSLLPGPAGADSDAGFAVIPPNGPQGAAGSLEPAPLPIPNPAAAPTLGEACNGQDDDGDGETDEVDFEVATLSVTFDARTLVEPDHAFIHVRTGTGDPVQGSPFTGDALSGKTLEVVGNAVRIRITSDAQAVPLFGYAVVQIEDDSGRPYEGELPESPHASDGTHAYPAGVDHEVAVSMPDALGTGLACGQDTGECQRGVTTCIGGHVLCRDEVRPSPEICNGLDDDCDGETDEETAGEGWSCVGPGSFIMGSPGYEPGRSSGENQHEVQISRPFFVSQREITRELWVAHMPEDPSASRCEGCPVQAITWYEALAFCNVLSKEEGLTPCYLDPDGGRTYDDHDAEGRKQPVWPDGLDCEGYRLPTEAEWEYVARAGTSTPYYSGDSRVTGCDADPALEPSAWYCPNSAQAPHPVAVKQPNPWGLHDAHGNVWEWIWDGWRDALPTQGEVDPLGPDSSSYRAVRGGAFNSNASDCRSAKRAAERPDARGAHIGLRPVRTATN